MKWLQNPTPSTGSSLQICENIQSANLGEKQGSLSCLTGKESLQFLEDVLQAVVPSSGSSLPHVSSKAVSDAEVGGEDDEEAGCTL